MVNRTIILVVLFAWICATTVAQGAHTISSVYYTIIILKWNKFCIPRKFESFQLFVNADLASFTDDQCIGETYCGQFCCPVDSTCCPEERMCCGNDTMVERNFCGSDPRACPTSLPPDEVDDGTDQLRNQCCLYFRSGCCSANENQTLDWLWVYKMSTCTKLLLETWSR